MNEAQGVASAGEIVSVQRPMFLHRPRHWNSGLNDEERARKRAEHKAERNRKRDQRRKARKK